MEDVVKQNTTANNIQTNQQNIYDHPTQVIQFYSTITIIKILFKVPQIQLF